MNKCYNFHTLFRGFHCWTIEVDFNGQTYIGNSPEPFSEDMYDDCK